MSICAIYCRLSREDEDKPGDESESIRNQKALLKAAASERGWDIYDIYCDEDYSGADSSRPDFNRMIADAGRGCFDIILCKSQSRFTRDMELVEKYIHGKFPLWGVRFVTVADNVDTAAVGGKKSRQINGLVNEWYLEDLSQSVRTVLDCKREIGQFIGAFPPYGYLKSEDDKNRLTVDEQAAAVIRRIYRWYVGGESPREIAKRLDEHGYDTPLQHKRKLGMNCACDLDAKWSRATVVKILCNETYTGTMVQGKRKKQSYKDKSCVEVPKEKWIRVENTHPMIIDKETFLKVSEILRTKSRADCVGEIYALSGLVRCADCKKLMEITSNKGGEGGKKYLRCAGSKCKAGMCTRHSIRADKLQEAVCNALLRHIKESCEEEVLSCFKNFRGERRGGEVEKIVRQEKAITNAMELAYLDRAAGRITDESFSEIIKSLNTEKEKIKRQKMLAHNEAICKKTVDENFEAAKAELENICKGEIKRELFTMVIDRVEVEEKNKLNGKQHFYIYWKF